MPNDHFFAQEIYQIRCEWGLDAVSLLAPISEAVVIVDVLSFSTCVDIATNRGALIYPFGWMDLSSHEFAEQIGAVVAGKAGESRYSLAAESLLDVPAGLKLVLPSPNGSTLSTATGDIPTFTACLRNAEAVAKALQRDYTQISIIPAGERWASKAMRPALEDWIGAGAVIHGLAGTKSPEAKAAETLFLTYWDQLPQLLRQISSGRELIGKRQEKNIELAGELNISQCIPRLIEGAYQNVKR